MKASKFYCLKSVNKTANIFDYVESIIVSILLILLLLCTSGIHKVQAQTYGPTLFSEDFGTVPAGTSDPLLYRADITGRGTIGSTYTYNPTGQTEDGEYALTPDPTKIHSNAWIDMYDHTSNNGTGLMLVVNAALTKGIFYKREVPGLCFGSQFEFKAYYANVLHQDLGCPDNQIPINVRFEIWDKNPGDNEANSNLAVGGIATNGAKLLALTNTGNVTATNQTWNWSSGYSQTVDWRSTSLVFQVPLSTDGAFIVLRNNSNGGCGNDLAIDDITFRPVIPFTVNYSTTITDYCTTGKITQKAVVATGIVPKELFFIFNGR